MASVFVHQDQRLAQDGGRTKSTLRLRSAGTVPAQEDKEVSFISIYSRLFTEAIYP